MGRSSVGKDGPYRSQLKPSVLGDGFRLAGHDPIAVEHRVTAPRDGSDPISRPIEYIHPMQQELDATSCPQCSATRPFWAVNPPASGQ
jgi:hypothetical protein